MKQSIKAIRWLKTNNITLCTSIGMQTWELLTTLGSLYALRQKVFVPADSYEDFESEKDYVEKQFELDPDLTDYVPLVSSRKASSEKDKMLERDRAVVESADVLLPVSLRKNGQMRRLLRQRNDSARTIVGDFETPHEKRTRSLAYKISARQLSPGLDDAKGKYIVHWTRSSNSAWPTEKLIDYYRAVIESDHHPRTALDTLLNIVSTKTIKASAKNMPRKIPTVSFSSLAPSELVKLIRWRSRYSQMSFEPYGVGIEKEYAETLGVQPVIYYRRGKPGLPDAVEPWLTQSEGKKSDWGAEKEYRRKGDMDISEIPHDRMILFCYTSAEARLTYRKTGIKTVPFVDG